jgi:hypothetical protein
MRTERRRFIACLAGGLFASVATLRKLFADRAPVPFEADESLACSPNEVERLLTCAAAASSVSAQRMTWIASATITLFSVPVFSRRGVGSGYAVVEEARLASGENAVSIQFGAGSWPESAHGLNRFGLIHEVTLENRNGAPDESAYGAFITASREKNIDQASQALKAQGAEVPYVAAQGHASQGRFVARVASLEFPSNYTWRDADSLMTQVWEIVAHSACPPKSQRGGAGLFLYSVHQATIDARTRTEGSFFFNGKRFGLRTTKQKDSAIGERLAERNVVTHADEVIRLDAVIREENPGSGSEIETPFRVWYQAGAGKAPPVRFEYQARSFLRLVFELDTTVQTPRFGLAIRSKQNA